MHIPVHNSAALVAWNTDKRYLAELQTKGIAIPQTRWLEPGASVDLPTLLHEHACSEVVVKPAISMNGDDTFRVRRSEAHSHQARLDALLLDRSVMVQAFVPEILSDGEVSLIYFAGRFSHAVVKRPRAGEFRIQEEHGGTHRPYSPAPALLRDGERVLAQLPEVPLYARVDGVCSDGRFLLLELEVIDPSLFLRSVAGAAERFATAILDLRI
jgi:glutathione synthase/RimK-type ligase-like ATP-grasp enzyme